jgi:hypothetical protein
MRKRFANTYDEHDLLDFIGSSTYVPTENGENEELNRRVLYKIFDDHLNRESHVEIAEEHKER